MKVGEERLYQTAQKFRHAIEDTDISEEVVGREGYLRMQNFPSSACAEACSILGIYLVENQKIDPLAHRTGQIGVQDQWYGSHHWLVHDNIVIDISADQFPIVDEPVIVSHESEFHSRYAQDKSTITTCFARENTSDWILKLYSAVRSNMNSQGSMTD